MSAYTKGGSAALDLYKILSVSPSSTTQEIKKAYYRIALQSHPDKHNGCSVKLERFKRVNEAYDILSNPTKRNEYDLKIGNIYHSSFTHKTTSKTYKRKTPIPKDYRKVYTSRPPPNWKTTWDHAKHYEMHYGNGFQKEAMAQAIKSAKAEGTFVYRSSIGKGFSFDHLKDSQSAENDDGAKSYATSSSTNYNPYSKNTVQGPPKYTFQYEEVSNFSGKEHVLKHERIVYDLHLRRYKRYVKMTTQTSDTAAHRSPKNHAKQESTSEAASSTAASKSSPNSSRLSEPPSAIYSRYSWTHRQSVSKLYGASHSDLKNQQSVKVENSAAPSSRSSGACIIM
jgi:curved DNA-binding protein CbpA